MLRASRRLLKPGGRLAFFTIHAAPDLDAAGRRLARRYGPTLVNSRSDYVSMLERVGFRGVRAIDVTREYLRISRAWNAARARHAAGLRNQVGEARFHEMERDSRMNIAGIEMELLRRSLFVAIR